MRSVAFAAGLLALNALAFGADRRGTYDSCCHSATFHLRASSPQEPSDEITLQVYFGGLSLNRYIAGADWWNAQGKRCSRSDQCEETKAAKLQFQKITDKRVSGNYVFESNQGRIEGQFSVKRRHQGKPCICE